jgi:GT2 family glycosyltransferase
MNGTASPPSVTLVFLVYNRRDELRTSLRKMLVESDYAGAVDAIVVDNASTDGSAEMVREEFPQVQVVVRDENCGVSAWNDGFALARGDWVLALDDDCYLPADGLRRAVDGALEHGADLVSFAVESSYDSSVRFDQRYRTGLLTFWGCAVLMRREVLHALEGFDPGIFIWAHELEFMLRFFDRGYRHLHLPEVTAVHIKEVTGHWTDMPTRKAYHVNARHWGYIAAKLLRPRDAVEALVAIVALSIRDGLRMDRAALAAAPQAVKGFASGLRRRSPVRNRMLSRTYRRNFHSFASPWWLSRPLHDLVLGLPREVVDSVRGRPRNGAQPAGRRDDYFRERARYYPDTASTLKF